MRRTLLPLLIACGLLAGCKVVNTHVFKVTGGPEFSVNGARIPTTKGYLDLSAKGLTEKQAALLKSLRPFQCLSVRTGQDFDMNLRVVRFDEFELKKLNEGDKECRKIATTPRISVQ